MDFLPDITAALGGLAGGIFRLIPEGIKFFDRKAERTHEKDMFSLQLEADKLRSSQQVATINAQAEGSIGLAEMQALAEAVKSQGLRTGIKWVDAINSLMRPVITFWWCIVMYSVALYAEYVTLTSAGLDYVAAILELWGPDEKAIVAAILSFWFIDRSLKKMAGHK